MALIKLAGLSIVIVVFILSTRTLGETEKVGELKASDKRGNNFRVPVEMPYDPNFWPARGRRSRRDPEKAAPTDYCITSDGNFMFVKNGLQCPENPKIHEEEIASRKSGPLDFELMPPINLDDELSSGGEKMNCYGNGMASKTTDSRLPSKGRMRVKIPDVLETNLLMTPKRFVKLRAKKQKYDGLPPVIFYENGVYWEPENLHEEKKKKQDVFWVARGKKTFNFHVPQN